ncbi:MAG: S46 family peptidase, partial [Bacteroidota bacterium]
HPELMEDFKKKGANKFVDKLYKKSFLVNKEDVQEFLDDPDYKDLTKDPIFELTQGFYQMFLEKIAVYLQAIRGESKAAYRIYVQGMMEMADGDQLFYPDANSTMRLTYGTIMPYDPRDAVSYDWITTHKGLLQKHKDGDYEFDVPDRLLELIRKGDFGKYANANGDLPVNFLTDNDITGGNSGSPVINGKGELIDLAFDGNIEASAGDFLFGGLNRTISVDSRYVLFLVDKFHNADRIIEEMDIVK